MFKPFDKESLVINTQNQIDENDEDRELDMAQSPGLKIADDAIKELQFGVAELMEIRMSLPNQKDAQDDVLDQLDPLSSTYKKEPKPKAVSKKYYQIKK